MTLTTRVGVLGGTFDPIHNGHLDAAEAARFSCGLDHVLLMPSGVPPHRSANPRASERHRFAMASLASAEREGLIASDIELQSTSPSFTSATLDRLVQAGTTPQQLFFITGADAFVEIASWYDYPAVLDRSHFIVVSRPGHPAGRIRELVPDLQPRMREPRGQNPNRDAPLSIWLLEAQTRPVSSSQLRQYMSEGRSIKDLVPDIVATYITTHGLYEPCSGEQPA